MPSNKNEEYTTTIVEIGEEVKHCTNREYKNHLYSLGQSITHHADYSIEDMLLDEDLPRHVDDQLRELRQDLRKLGEQVYQAGINLQIHNEGE